VLGLSLFALSFNSAVRRKVAPYTAASVILASASLLMIAASYVALFGGLDTKEFYFKCVQIAFSVGVAGAIALVAIPEQSDEEMGGIQPAQATRDDAEPAGMKMGESASP
jgi:hypothetical protein